MSGGLLNEQHDESCDTRLMDYKIVRGNKSTGLVSSWSLDRSSRGRLTLVSERLPRTERPSSSSSTVGELFRSAVESTGTTGTTGSQVKGYCTTRKYFEVALPQCFVSRSVPSGKHTKNHPTNYLSKLRPHEMCTLQQHTNPSHSTVIILRNNGHVLFSGHACFRARYLYDFHPPVLFSTTAPFLNFHTAATSSISTTENCTVDYPAVTPRW